MTVVSLQNFIFQLNCLCFWQQQERERVTTQLTTELSQLREELTTERLLTASLKDDLDSAAVTVSHG